MLLNFIFFFDWDVTQPVNVVECISEISTFGILVVCFMVFFSFNLFVA